MIDVAAQAIQQSVPFLTCGFEYADAEARLPVSMQRGGERYTLGWDHVGSLRAVIDAQGAVVKEMVYDAFGSILRETNAEFRMPFGFAGGLHDRDTNLIRYRFKDYLPDMGRFAAKDPIGYKGGDADLYGYCLDDPVNHTDRLGLLMGGLIPAGENYGEEAAMYWAERGIQPDNEWYEDLAYGFMGSLASLWTPETSDATLATLAGGYVARVLGPFGVEHVPRRVQRVRRYIRFDKPHHKHKRHHLDGDLYKWLKRKIS